MEIVKKVVIVGGGSSAWLTAAYLSKQCPHIEFTVIDKEIGNPIGVGEGTLLSFQIFMQECGFELKDWFMELEATYKTGALFPDWLEKGHTIWHPFLMSPIVNEGPNGTIRLQSAWSHHQEYDFKTYGAALYETAVNQNKIDPSIIDTYAFHIDCGKLVQFMQKRLADRINFVASDVVGMEKNGDNIVSLSLANGSKIYGDLFIDCTGFKSILRTEKDRVELLGRVFCDTAVCGQIQYENLENEMRPYTRAQAVDHGWLWTIPTQSRMGSGIIFNKSVTDVEEAKDYFVNYWGGRITKDKLRVIDWTPFYLKDPWKGNVVCIGMSSGFIEPLESTGLALVQFQAHSLMNIIRNGIYQQGHIDIYNTAFAMMFEDCVDFVSAHYSRTNRTEKFWEFVKDTYMPTEGILIQLELLKNGPRHASQKQNTHVFGGTNWTTWMAQLGYKIGADPTLDKDRAEFLMLRYYNTLEKFRPNWCQHHATDLLRATEYAKYYNK
jgi:tryptophan halogenase